MAIAVSASSPIQSPRLESPRPIQRWRKSRIRSTAASECVGRVPQLRHAAGSAGALRSRRSPYAVTAVPAAGQAFLAAAFFAAVFFGRLLRVVFLAVFFAVFFAPFLAAFFAGPLARRSASSSAARSMVIVASSSPWRRVALYSPSVT